MHINLKDPTVYRWILSQRRDAASAIGGMIGAVFVVPVLTYFLFWFIGLFSGIWAVRICLIIGSFYFLTFVYNLILTLGGRQTNRFPRDKVGPLTSIFVMSCLIFLASYPDSPFYNGFEGITNSLSQWFYFFLDNFLKVFLLDILEIFELHTSTIVPITIQARTLTVVLRAMIAFGVVEIIILLHRGQSSQRQEYYGTTEECFEWLDGLLYLDDDSTLTREGVVLEMPNTDLVLADKFIHAVKDIKKKNRAH
jgi:hypothetical protein